jgi:hypothetical protein
MNTLRKAGLCLTMALAAGIAPAAVDSSLLNLVMPDAKILSGIQVDQAVMSPFGQYMLSQIQPTDPGFLSFVQSTGFDPRYNLKYILAATSADPNVHNALILGTGTFVPSKIIAAATTAGGTVTQYKGVSILTGPNENGHPEGSLALIDASTVAIGDLASVQGAVDRRLGNAAFTGALASQAVSVSNANQAWFATVTPLSDFLNGKTGNLGNISQNNLFQSVLQASGGVNFSASGVTMTGDAVTASAQNAQALVDVLKFLVSMVSTNANNATATTLADASSFTVNGSTAHLTLNLSEQQAEQLFTAQPKKAAARARH